MDRRNFLLSLFAAPLALKAGGSALAAVAYDPADATMTANFAADPDAPKMILWQLPNQQPGPQMMGYVMRMENGQTIVFDGGWKEDAPYLVDLVQKECGGRVDAWFLTHAHIDHCGAIAEILENMPKELDITALYCNFPEKAWLDEYEPGSKDGTAVFYDAIHNFSGFKKLAPDQIFEYGPLRMECLNDFDPEIHVNAINNATITFRLDVGGKSILILGDLGYEGGDRLLEAQGEKLSVDVCQMAHHGQQGVRRSFYEVVRPSVTLWPTPD